MTTGTERRMDVFTSEAGIINPTLVTRQINALRDVIQAMKATRTTVLVKQRTEGLKEVKRRMSAASSATIDPITAKKLNYLAEHSWGS